MTEERSAGEAARRDVPLLTAITLERLYGKYTHEIKVPRIGDVPGRLIILHGDNGCGKSSLLRLLWNALSPSNDRGHRTRLAHIPFASLTINLSDGTDIIIKKVSGLVGSFSYVIKCPDGPDIDCILEVNNQPMHAG